MEYIGISPRISSKKVANNQYEFLNINMTYCDFIHLLGYEYLILPFNLNANLLKNCIGFLIIGGEDIDPTYYGEENTNSIIEPAKIDEIDFQIIDYAIKNHKFVLGICRGIQVINVYFGGSLVQDLGSNNHLHHQNHQILKVNQHPLIAELANILTVNSLHHQAIKKLGASLIPLYQADNIIEMIIHQKYPIVGVQWHPERMETKHQLKFKKIIKELRNDYEIQTNKTNY